MNFSPGQNKPKAKRTGWVNAAVILTMVVTLSCSLNTGILSKETQISSSNSPLGLIAYVGTDGNIYTIDRDGKKKTPITQDANLRLDTGQARIYQYPTWAPNGQMLSYVGFTSPSQGITQASLYTSSSDGKNLKEAFSSQDVIPFYLFWSPKSDYVTFLSSSSSGLVLQMAAAAGGDSKVIGSGQPFYWDWSPDNKTIIAHTGGAVSENPDARMVLFELDGSIQKKDLDVNPGSFQAPAWSPGGEELALLAENGSGGEELILAGRDGKVKRVLAQLSGPVAFGWSLDGSRLAYMTSASGDPNNLSKRLILLNPAQPDSGKEIAQGIVVAFFWSPDSRKIAYFNLGLQGPSGISLKNAQSNPRINLEVLVHDLDSGYTKQVAAFEPTNAFQQVFPFFDQYQRSGTIWSPDSKNLVLAGIDNNGSPGIYVVSADGGQSHKIADGDLAFWAWK